jgi:phytoene desaturase
MAKSAIIVGAGLGGLATAIRLARDGWKVKVLEKNSRVGGKLDFHSEKGFIWDVGPTLVTLPFVLREVFEYAGHDIEDYLDLMPVDPICRYFYPDGKIINSWVNFHHFQIEVARREKDHGEALERFLRYSQGLFDLAWDSYLSQPSSQVGGHFMGALKSMHHLPKVWLGGKMTRTIDRFFKDPHIRQLFLNYAAQHGSSPQAAHSICSVLPFAELHGGAWYIRGGIYRLAEALEKCARDLGVEFLVDAEVSEIALEEQGWGKPKATGVTIRGGVKLEAEAIICNADINHVWSRLLHHKVQPSMVKSLERNVFSTAPFIILWGMKRKFEQLAHRNVFFSSDVIAEHDDIFQKKRIASEPTIHISISGRTDPTQAPKDQDNFAVLVHTPALETDHHWENKRESYRKTILDRLQKMGLAGLENEIVTEKIITPAEFALRNNSYRGSMYGQALHSVKNVIRRPSNKSEEIENLYFVGGSTRPGGGVPFVLLSAQRVVRMVNQNQ